jgi:hypothetical protein
MKEMQFEVLPRYAAMGIERNRHYLLSAFIRTNLNLGVWTLLATLVGLLRAWLRRDLKRFAPIFLGALSAYTSVVMQVRFHDYYFQTCYPFFSAIWAYLVVSLYECCLFLARKCKQRGWRLAAGLVWVVFAQAVFWPLPEEYSRLTMWYEELREWRADPEGFYANYPRQLPFEHLAGELEVIDFLRKNARPNDSVYVWTANCAIYYLSGRQPPTRFVSNLGIISLWAKPSWREELVRDLGSAQPRFIIVTRRDALPPITYVNLDSEEYLKSFAEFDSFLTSRYKSVADFDTFVIYGRNGKGPSTGEAMQGLIGEPAP